MYMSSNVRVIYQSADNSYLVAWEKFSCEAGCYRRILARHMAANGTWLSDVLTIGEDVDQSDKTLGEIAVRSTESESVDRFQYELPAQPYFWRLGSRKLRSILLNGVVGRLCLGRSEYRVSLWQQPQQVFGSLGS